MRPAPATQPWPGSVNWTAASAGGVWPEAGGVVVAAALELQDADDVVPEEPVLPGVDLVPADALEVPAGVVDLGAADPDDAAAQPAAEPATASTVSAEAAARRARGGGAGDSNVGFARVLKGISFVTFQMTLYPLARLYRGPSV